MTKPTAMPMPITTMITGISFPDIHGSELGFGNRSSVGGSGDNLFSDVNCATAEYGIP